MKYLMKYITDINIHMLQFIIFFDIENLLLIIQYTSITSCDCPVNFLCFTSSIGMAKAALEAINGFNVYGMQVSKFLAVFNKK